MIAGCSTEHRDLIQWAHVSWSLPTESSAWRTSQLPAVYRQREHSVSSGGTRGIVRGNSVSSEGTPGIRLEPHVMPPHGIPKARIASVPWQDVGLFSTSWANTLPAASTFLEPHHLEQSSSPLSEMPSKQSFTPSKCSKWLLTWTGEGGSLISLAFSHLSLCCNSCRQEG